MVDVVEELRAGFMRRVTGLHEGFHDSQQKSGKEEKGKSDANILFKIRRINKTDVWRPVFPLLVSLISSSWASSSNPSLVKAWILKLAAISCSLEHVY